MYVPPRPDPVEDPLSASGWRYGDHIAKLSVAPASDNARALTGVDMPDLSRSGIERAVAEAVRDQPVSFDQRVR